MIFSAREPQSLVLRSGKNIHGTWFRSRSTQNGSIPMPFSPGPVIDTPTQPAQVCFLLDRSFHQSDQLVATDRDIQNRLDKRFFPASPPASSPTFCNRSGQSLGSLRAYLLAMKRNLLRKRLSSGKSGPITEKSPQPSNECKADVHNTIDQINNRLYLLWRYD